MINSHLLHNGIKHFLWVIILQGRFAHFQVFHGKISYVDRLHIVGGNSLHSLQGEKIIQALLVSYVCVCVCVCVRALTRDWSLITGRGGYKTGKLRVQNLLHPSPQDRVKLFAPPPCKLWKPFMPPPFNMAITSSHPLPFCSSPPLPVISDQFLTTECVSVAMNTMLNVSSRRRPCLRKETCF